MKDPADLALLHRVLAKSDVFVQVLSLLLLLLLLLLLQLLLFVVVVFVVVFVICSRKC